MFALPTKAGANSPVATISTLYLILTLLLFSTSIMKDTSSPGVSKSSFKVAVSVNFAVPPFSKVPSRAFSLTTSSKDLVVIEFSFTIALTSTLAALTAMLMFDSLVKSANVAPQMSERHIITVKIEVSNNFFFIFYSPF